MNIPILWSLFQENDGSLPDVILNFHGTSVVVSAYSYVQNRATHFPAASPHYWSATLNKPVSIAFGSDPASEFIRGEAEPFHVVFSGLRSSTGATIPDLGFFVLAHDHVYLDYRMGSDWKIDSIVGLFEMLLDLSRLAPNVTISSGGNNFDPNGISFEAAFRNWSETSISDKK